MSAFFNSSLKRFSTLIRSIRVRLALWFVLILGIVVVAFSVFIYIRQVHDLQDLAIVRLDIKMQRLGRSLRFSGSQFYQTPPARFPTDPISGESFLQEGDLLALVDPNGKVLQNWGNQDTQTITPLTEKALQGGNLPEIFTSQVTSTTSSGNTVRANYVLMFMPLSQESGMGGYFLIGDPIDPGNQLPRLLFSLILGILVTLAVALVGGFWLADRAMRPVAIITNTARTISETDLHRRIHLDRKDELGELANTFDDMLERLQAAFDRQRQFTADASHELRTPLTIVELEASRALETQRSPQEYTNALKVIHSENHIMTRLVTNLLTLARMDAGQISLEKQELDLSDLALEVVERLAPLAMTSQVRLSAGDLPELRVIGDRQLLTQMLTNLVENAIKYSIGEEKCVEVTTELRQAGQAEQAVARIIDTGPGIPAEHLPHIFNRFYRVDPARTRQEIGRELKDGQTPSSAGLGLSIAQWIAQAHAGQIRVKSEVGKGSVFEVTLPLAKLV